MSVVWGGRQKEPMFKALGHVAHGACDLRIDGILGLGCRGGHMGLIEDQQAAREEVPEPIAQTDLVVLVAKQRMANQKLAMGCPGVYAEASFASAGIDIGFVHYDKCKAKPLGQLIAPLEQDRRGTCDHNPLDTLSEEQLLEHKAGFDGFDEADVVW